MEELSPFTSKIGTNYAASTRDEAERITAFFAGPLSKLQRLQTEIVRVKACYDEIVEQYLALSREIEAHKALISPIRRVPTDILQPYRVPDPAHPYMQRMAPYSTQYRHALGVSTCTNPRLLPSRAPRSAINVIVTHT